MSAILLTGSIKHFLEGQKGVDRVPGPGYEEDGWRLTSRFKLEESSAMVGRPNFPLLNPPAVNCKNT